MEFASAQSRANASVMRLANAQALFSGAVDSIPVIFDKAAERSAVGVVGLVSTAPAITLLTASVPDAPEGLALTVDGDAYTVAEHDPDGTGMSMLYLTKA